LEAIQLTAVDVAAIKAGDWAGVQIPNKRERDEYLAKIKTLNLGGNE
jgi:hypothetical protein